MLIPNTAFTRYTSRHEKKKLKTRLKASHVHVALQLLHRIPTARSSSPQAAGTTITPPIIYGNTATCTTTTSSYLAERGYKQSSHLWSSSKHCSFALFLIVPSCIKLIGLIDGGGSTDQGGSRNTNSGSTPGFCNWCSKRCSRWESCGSSTRTQSYCGE